MINFLVIVITFITLGYLFNPYLTSFVNYVSYGLGEILKLFDYIISIISTFLNSLASYNYIMMMFGISIAIVGIFYIIDFLKGD